MFPTQRMNLRLLLCRQILYHLSHQENPFVLLLAYYLYHYKIFFLVVVLTFTAFSPSGYQRIYFFNRLHATVNLKNAQCESCESSFIWGQNEDCSLGDSTSDNSENLPQRGQYICDFGEVGIHVIKLIFLQISASLMKLLLVMRNSCHHEAF